MALKLLFMGTPEFAVPILKKLNNSEHQILSVYTQPPKKSQRGQKINKSHVQEFCEKNRISLRSPENLKDKKEIDYLKNLSPDVVIVVAYGQILPLEILEISNIKFLNIHASLLPKWRGAAPIQRSIIEMDKETGISIMKIVPKLDAGPYLIQEKIKIDKNDNYISLSKKLSLLGSEMILKSLKLIEKKNYNLTEQDENKASYASKIEKSESEIKWNLPSKNLVAKIKGLNPYPGTWFNHKGNRLRIIDAIEVNQSGKEGTILDDNLTIACKENAIKILLIQKEGKKILKAREFLAGYKILKGENLN